MNELQIVVNQQRGVISTNFEDIKKELSAQMQIYKELETTDANKAERKKDIATLRKMKTAIKDKRIEVKKECLKPYDVYEKLSDELEEIVNMPIGIIDNQVKELEERQRIEKQNNILKTFEELIAEYPELSEEIGLVNVYDNHWETVAVTPKAIKAEMTVKLVTIRDNVALINSMVSDKTEEALRLFWGDLDIAKAMGMITQYEAQKRQIEQQLIEKQQKEKELEAERERMAKERELERERERVRIEERSKIKEEERIKEEARKKAFDEESKIREEERKKAAEAEECIREEERAKAQVEEERIREEERLATEKRLMSIKVSDPEDDLEAPFDVDEAVAVFTVTGTVEELQQVEMYLNSIGLMFKRED